MPTIEILAKVFLITCVSGIVGLGARNLVTAKPSTPEPWRTARTWTAWVLLLCFFAAPTMDVAGLKQRTSAANEAERDAQVLIQALKKAERAGDSESFRRYATALTNAQEKIDRNSSKAHLMYRVAVIAGVIATMCFLVFLSGLCVGSLKELIKRKNKLHDAKYDHLWAAAFREFDSAGRKEGLYARLYTKYRGNDRLVRSEYIRARVSQLKSADEEPS